MTQIVTENGLSAQQTQLIDALLCHPTRQAAANAIGISRSTLYRWLREDIFSQALADAQRATVEESTARLIGLQLDAITTINELRQTGQNSDAVRLKAAMFIVQITRELHSDAMASQRIAALESLINDQDI